MRRLRAIFNLSLLIRNPQKLSSSSTLVPPLQYNRSHTLLTRNIISSVLRGYSASTATSELYEVGFVTGHKANRYESVDEEEVVRYVPVKAYFLSTSIDLKSLQVDNACNVIPPSSRSLNYTALRYSDFPSEITMVFLMDFIYEKRIKFGFSGYTNNTDLLENRDHRYPYRYVVVFQYGSAVLFNIADHEAEQYLDIVRKHASGLLSEMRKDDYAVVEKPSLPTWMQGGLDFIVLKSLDTDGIRIIGSVLGQSIALDHYIRQFDNMVEEFTDINRVMEKTGNFNMERKKLFQLVGKANSNLSDVIIRLGLFDRSEIAWKNANYAQILEYLREEYELNQRFGSLDFKLKFVEHNIHFLQEVLQNRRSDLLEWGIIILLIIENAISMYEIVKDTNIISS